MRFAEELGEDDHFSFLAQHSIKIKIKMEDPIFYYLYPDNSLFSHNTICHVSDMRNSDEVLLFTAVSRPNIQSTTSHVGAVDML